MTQHPNLNIRKKEKSQFLSLIKKFKPLLLSHHPNCAQFKNHTLTIGKLKFCIGCFVGYPTALLGILIIYFFNLEELLASVYFLIIGIILISFFLLSPLNLTKIKRIKIIQKLLIGLGSAFLFWWIWSLPFSFTLNSVLFLLIFGTLITLLNGYHAYSFYRTCKKCKFSMNWQTCPGFKEFYKN